MLVNMLEAQAEPEMQIDISANLNEKLEEIMAMMGKVESSGRRRLTPEATRTESLGRRSAKKGSFAA